MITEWYTWCTEMVKVDRAEEITATSVPTCQEGN